jgi:hypothetical protein
LTPAVARQIGRKRLKKKGLPTCDATAAQNFPGVQISFAAGVFTHFNQISNLYPDDTGGTSEKVVLIGQGDLSDDALAE